MVFFVGCYSWGIGHTVRLSSKTFPMEVRAMGTKQEIDNGHHVLTMTS